MTALPSVHGPGAERPAILLSSRFPPALRETLAQRYTVLAPRANTFAESVASISPDEAAAVRAVVTMGMLGISGAEMSTLPALGLVVCFGTGYDGIDVEAARKRAIAVAHSPGANASSVADIAIGLAIASVRNMFDAADYLKSGQWAERAKRAPGGRGLTGRRMGVFGLGDIGAKIASRAVALEMEVGYCNRRQREDLPYQWYPSLMDLASWADVLMISVRADASTRHAVNADVLRALGPDGHVVNISRGYVIDERALIDALTEGTIAGAGLDVFEVEPLAPGALSALPNVVLTPHIGGETTEAMAAMGQMVLANLDAFFDGRPVPYLIPESRF